MSGPAVYGGAAPDEREEAAALTSHPGGSRLDFDSENFVVAAPLTAGSAASPGVNPPGRRKEDDENLVAYQCHGNNVGPMGTMRQGNGGLTGGVPFAAAGMTVRRLTPVECLRLMGAGDDFLDLDPPLSDSVKYRLCGNGVVVNCAYWIARRMKAAMTPEAP